MKTQILIRTCMVLNYVSSMLPVISYNTNQVIFISWMTLYFLLSCFAENVFFFFFTATPTCIHDSFTLPIFTHCRGITSSYQPRDEACVVFYSCITCQTWLSKHFIMQHFNWISTAPYVLRGKTWLLLFPLYFLQLLIAYHKIFHDYMYECTYEVLNFWMWQAIFPDDSGFQL